MQNRGWVTSLVSERIRDRQIVSGEPTNGETDNAPIGQEEVEVAGTEMRRIAGAEASAMIVTA